MTLVCSISADAGHESAFGAQADIFTPKENPDGAGFLIYELLALPMQPGGAERNRGDQRRIVTAVTLELLAGE